MALDLYVASSVVIASERAAIYELVADVTRMGEWSPICTGGHWETGSGPWPGGWFTGTNERGGRAWETRSRVETADPGKRFSFVVGGSHVRWSYTLTGAGVGTELTEAWELLPDGLAQFRTKYGSEAETVVADRRDAARWSIPITLAAIKAAAEAMPAAGPNPRGTGTEEPDVPVEPNRGDLGLALMKEMLGEESVARIEARNAIAPQWHRWTTEVLFGDLWQGQGLNRKQRSMITIAALIPLNRSRELGIHLRAALVNGVTKEELVEIVQHVAFYTGWPSAGEALFMVRDIINEQPDDQQ
jgi:alkylhydroperoxidase/carboxymuconolactone decarboxylase family protein YurZ